MHENQEHKQKWHAPFPGVELLPATARIHFFVNLLRVFMKLWP